MTRLAVLADIHGNLPALQAVIDDMAQYAVDHVVVAGDSVNWGPFSRQVLEIISERRWAVIRGNNAYYALDFGTCRAPEHWKSFTLPIFLREQLGRCLAECHRLPTRYALLALSRRAADSRFSRHSRRSLRIHQSPVDSERG